ncbi:MAG: ATP-dependent DNA helicase RecG [Endomicrobium sp.]|jgi:ATP-dependent DNA helicase RecG|nr:ATP-dependent DNA helicase RecG [Endomicrobium sp.]
MKAIHLDTDVQYLKGIGPKRTHAFLKLGIHTLMDILVFFPRQYQDRTKIILLKDISENELVCLFVKIGSYRERTLSNGLVALDIEIFDDSSITVTVARFFRKKNPYSFADVFASVKKVFNVGSYAYIYGELNFRQTGRFISVIDYEVVTERKSEPVFFKKIVPVYETSEKLSQKFIREIVKSALSACVDLYPDISGLFFNLKNIPNMRSNDAIQKIHYPGSLEEAEHARRAFALQEFMVLETALCLSRNSIKKNYKAQRYIIYKTFLTPFKNKLGFEFTKEQKKAINDIFADMQSPYPMNRILMGEVGCGKTAVALSAVLLAVENGYQTMIVSPTEILAEQHYLTISNVLSGLNLKTAFAVSSTLRKKSNRNRILAGIEDGTVKIAVGTHSLMEGRIKFKNLSLIVVDEQQKFGVMQKFAALNKAATPDILMTTATPIPRALAMTLYGEMDVTAITSKPFGRLPAKTYSSDEKYAYENALKELKKGNQIYIVYPLVENSDKIFLKSATGEFEKLSKTWFKDFKVGLLHGKMKPSEKNDVMMKFKNKEYDVLITTSIIEVGIDVPDATVMIVHNADRFGLSALHQLRGRIGRSIKQSYMYLIKSSNSKSALKRLSIMTSTDNGFKIAEEDLKMRGPGELMGTIQHGFPEFKAGDITRDSDIIEFTKNCAAEIIKDDPLLVKKKNTVLRNLINERFSNRIKLINVG